MKSESKTAVSDNSYYNNISNSNSNKSRQTETEYKNRNTWKTDKYALEKLNNNNNINNNNNNNNNCTQAEKPNSYAFVGLYSYNNHHNNKLLPKLWADKLST